MPAVWSSAKILEFDFAGIEAVLLGRFMNDPAYIRLAKLGIHAYVASHVLKRPADLSWPDAELAAYFTAIKNAPDAATELAYNQCKRTVHGKGYGMTVHGLLRNNPQYFRTLKQAQAIDDVYCAVAPALPKFHEAVFYVADTQRYLGGPGDYTYTEKTPTAPPRISGHPYAYRHTFNSVVAYERLNMSQVLWRKRQKLPVVDFNGIMYGYKLGDDAKRAIAFYPQSTARGVLTEAALKLFDPDGPWVDRCYIGDCYYGETPLRAPIHDSLLLEVPTRMVDRVVERCALAMQWPVEALPLPAAWGMGTHLAIGVDAKIGPDWGEMKKLPLPSLAALGVSNDTAPSPSDDEDEDEQLDLQTPLEGAA